MEVEPGLDVAIPVQTARERNRHRCITGESFALGEDYLRERRDGLWPIGKDNDRENEASPTFLGRLRYRIGFPAI